MVYLHGIVQQRMQTAGTLVVQGGIEYKNNWWTQGNNPTTNNGAAGTGQPWTKQAVCGIQPDTDP